MLGSSSGCCRTNGRIKPASKSSIIAPNARNRALRSALSGSLRSSPSTEFNCLSSRNNDLITRAAEGFSIIHLIIIATIPFATLANASPKSAEYISARSGERAGAFANINCNALFLTLLNYFLAIVLPKSEARRRIIAIARPSAPLRVAGGYAQLIRVVFAQRAPAVSTATTWSMRATGRPL